MTLLYAGFTLLFIYYTGNFAYSTYATFDALEDSTQDTALTTALVTSLSLVFVLVTGLALNLYLVAYYG